MITPTLVQAIAVAADQQAKSPNGALGLLVFLIVAVAVVFLLRSMVKQLNKVKKINFDEPPDAPNALDKGTMKPPRR
jgi:cytochrome c biogenesis protein CcdA